MITQRNSKLTSAITVADLIEELQGLPQDALVLFSCNYGDYHRTQQALPVSRVDAMTSGSLVESAYSHSEMALVEDSEKSFYCPTCNEECDSATCPKCGAVCVNEDGTPADTDDEDGVDIVILR